MNKEYHPTTSTKPMERAVGRIGDTVIEQIDYTYGSGYPHWNPGERPLSYHNGRHGRVVGSGALALCADGGLTPFTQRFADMLGKAHDRHQLEGRGVDEAASADWVVERLRESGEFNHYWQSMAQLAIRGTEPFFVDGVVSGQYVDHQEYPSHEAEYLARSLASADLGDIYTPSGPYAGHQYFRELQQGTTLSDDFSIQAAVDFQEGNIKLLETYRYPLAGAERVLATHRKEVIAYTNEVLKALKDGLITSWQQLFELDEAFMLRHQS